MRCRRVLRLSGSSTSSVRIWSIITPLVGVVASSQLDLLRSAPRTSYPVGGVRLELGSLLEQGDHSRRSRSAVRLERRAEAGGAGDARRAPERVVVTGAQCFDRWFDRHPSRDRADFARHVGLPDDRPFVLWVCSALFPGSPSEAAFVMRWAAHLRASSIHMLRNAGILIRPHPSRAREWDDVDWRAVPGVAFWGGNPVDDQSRADYFDSLYHSNAVVGLNTSAFIEAGIAQRPVLAILPMEFSSSQEGTLHFRYLIEGGLLTTARTLDEHEEQLGTMLQAPPVSVMRRQQEFVRSFVRPHGLDVSSTHVMADALESLGAGRRVEKISVLHRSSERSVSRRFARSQRPGGQTLLLDEREVKAKKRRAEEERASGAAGIA